MVAESFSVKDISDAYVQTINGDEEDVCSDNLELRSKYNGKKIKVVETGRVYNSIDECSNILGISRSTISRCVNYPFYSNRLNYPQHVKVRVYNEKTGQREDIILPKASVAIIENPFYAVFNEQNSTMQRLIRKLNILDIVDEQSSAGKLDLIIQLPYVTRSDTKRQEAQRRRKEMEDQLMNSKYGVAYADSSEKIIQLNRSLDNNLMKQIEYLTNMLYSQLGITQAILDGSANEQELLNYNNRLIEPIVSAIVDEMKRKFLTKTARSQLQTIKFFRDPFKLVPINNIADIADKFTRNEILTSNEIRQIIGMKPSNDPKADQLINSNLNQPENAMNQPVDSEELEKNPENYDQPEEQQENTSQDKNNVSIMDIPISQLPNFV